MKRLSFFVMLYAFVNVSFGLTIDGVLLLTFKYSVLSDPLRVLESWNYSDETPCLWRGVTCGYPSMSVLSVSLPNSQILGTIPEDMGRIQFLQTLDLSNNSINGSIPLTLFSTSQIQFLDLSNNLISGEIPKLVDSLTSLRVLNLSDNALAGDIPKNITSLGNLTVLNLKNNYLSGELPTGFNSLQVVDLSSNLVNGTLTSDFDGHNISYFNVSYNRLSGEIPPEFANQIPQNASLDFSFNNFTGEIPDSSVLIHQSVNSFAGNPELCGKPLLNTCDSNTSSVLSTPEKNVSAPSSPPAIAVIPKSIPSNPATNFPEPTTSTNSQHGLRKGTIIGIVVGDVAGVLVLALIFIYIYKTKKSKSGPWGCCLRRKHHDEESSEAGSTDDEEEEQQSGRVKQTGSGTIVTVDGEKELELETLLKASAYILGASSSSIMYKAVLEDGRTLAVRRIGENGVERFRDFENQIRVISKLVHPNLVRVRGFYWGADEKLVIYDYIPNGNLGNARYRKVGSSPCPLPWDVRLKIAKGIAKGLSFIHEKKHVHANLKPSNVLLDFDMEPKIGDFGLQRLVTAEYGSKANVSIRNFGSTRSMASRESFQENPSPSPNPSPFGGGSPYYAPESLRSLKPNPKWDVYSFGVLFLELLTGKVYASGEEILVEEKNKVLRMADVAIRSDMEGREDALLALLKLGFNCISVLPQNRHSMKEIVQALDKFPSYSNIKNY